MTKTEAKKTILLIEDDDSILSSIKMLLEDNDYIVLSATNGSEALKILESNSNPSLILLDLMMPIMDGFQFRKKQLANNAISKIPVVIMSADGHVSEKSIKTSASDYIKKPLDIFNLLDVIKKNIMAT